MALHGHTTIELTDVNTGAIERYDDDNIITDGIKDWFANPGGDIHMYAKRFDEYSYGSYPHPKYRLGGVYCFQNTVPEDATNYGFPSDNILVAHATCQTYDGDDATMGNYSSTESSILENGVSFVWNFSESQGNGEISSVCLGHPMGGLFGMGNDGSYNIMSEIPSNKWGCENSRLYLEGNRKYGCMDFHAAYRAVDNVERQYPSQYSLITTANGIWYADGENECVYTSARGQHAFSYQALYSFDEFLLTCGYIRLHKFRMPCNNFYPLEGKTGKYLGDVYINVPDEVKSTWDTSKQAVYGAHWSHGRHIYIFISCNYSNVLNVDAKAHILKVNVDDFSNVEVFTITNTTGVRLYIGSTIGGHCGGYNEYIVGQYVAGVGDYIFMRANDSPIDTYAINMRTNYVTCLGYLFTGSGSIETFYVIDENTMGISLANADYLININDMVPRKIASSTSKPYLMASYSSISNTYSMAFPVWYKNKRVKSYFIPDIYEGYITKMCNDTVYDNIYDFIENNVARIYELSMSRVVPATRNLYTINNLSSPVRKTPDKTMKITYTLYTDEDAT